MAPVDILDILNIARMTPAPNIYNIVVINPPLLI